MKRIIKPLLILLTGMLLLVSCAKKSTDTVYARVNGTAVSQREYDFFVSRTRAEVMSEYSQKYDISSYTDFWQTEFDGKTPSSVLSERALEKAAKAKVLFIEMKDRGIYDDVTWDYFEALAEKYNEEHKNQKTVGLKSIDMSKFYIYYLSTGEIELRNRLEKEGITDYDGYISSLYADMKIEM